MSFNEMAIAMTQKMVDDFFVAARAVPQDKLEWKPLDMGRSVLSLAQECAFSPTWAPDLLINRSMPDMTDEDLEAMTQFTSQWTTLDECERVCRENCEKLYAVIREFPESDLQETVTIQWGTFSMAELILLQYWNMLYHYGQINYIQTLYGDFQMR